MNWLIAYSVIVTLVLAWALVELKAERISSRMVDEFRENDRKFYRGWENIWFQQLKNLAASAPKKTAKPKTKRKSSK